MSSLPRLLALAVEVVLLVIRYRYDPERLKRELTERIDHELEERRGAFRKALATRDADVVSRMLADARDRARRKRLQHDAGSDVPAVNRPDDSPEGR
jgi:hypothetical protein